jgi:hypothetical protein
VQQMIAANGLTSANQIRTGQKLRVPTTGSDG